MKFTERDELQYVEYLKRKALPLTAHTDRTFGLILGRGIHRVNMNGATIAIFKFPSRTPKNEHQMVKISTFAEISKWSISPVWDGNLKIATVAPFIFTLCIPSPKISPIAPTVLAVRGGAIRCRCSSSCNSSFSVRLPYPGFFHSFYCKPQQFRTLASICVIRDLNLLPHVLFTANCHDKMLQIPNPFHPICSPVVSRELSLTSALMPCRYSLGTSW